MSQSEMVKLAVALGACFAVYKFAPMPAVKAGAVGVMATIIAKRLPYVGDALA